MAVLSVVAVAVMTMVLDPYIEGATFVLFYPAIMIVTLISGFEAGLLSAALSFAAAWYFFVPPRWSFALHLTDHTLGLMVFGVVALADVAIVTGMRFAVERYRALSRTLERRVEDRTEEAEQRGRAIDDKNRRLREANEEFLAMSERAGVFMSRLDLQGNVVDANRACVEGLGFSRADIIGKPLWKGGWWRISPEVEERVRQRVERAIAGEPSREETGYLTGEGEERITEMVLTPIRDDAGRVVSVLGSGLDITDRVRQYRATFENAGVGIAHLSPDVRWVRVNDTFARIVGYRPDELIGKSVQDITHPDDLAFSQEYVESLQGGADSYEMEKRYVRKDGTPVWVHLTGTAVRRGDGSIDHFVTFAQDVSARKHAEQLLQRQADLLNQSHDAILVWKIGGRGITYWSRGAEALYGYTAEEATGHISHELLHTREARAAIPIEEIEAQVVRHGSWYGELNHTTRDGRQIVVESRMVRVSYDGEPYALETNRDITERKRAEEQVRLLMREMTHRGKNMLSLVQAVARQTAASDPEHFIDRFTDRIQALAANQDLLVRASWKGVEVDDLVCAQLAHFSDLIGHRISLHGPKLRLNGAAAQAIGMALHELATNASKYGALSTDAGHVDIAWLTDDGRFKINWTERNGPPVRPPERRGFGTTVIAAMAERAVDGEVELDYDPAGVAWHLTCPAVKALDHY